MIPTYVSAKHKIVAVPYADNIQKFFPTAPTFQMHGMDHLAIPYGPKEAYMLHKFGYAVEPPILVTYNWPAPLGQAPFDVQRKTAAMLSCNDRAYVLNEYGTGKTRSALWAWEFLNNEGLAGKLLILAPLSTLHFTWSKECFDTLPHRKAMVLYGQKETRLKKLAEDADIYILNHDGFKVIEEELLNRTDIDSLVIDELASYRNGSAKKSKSLRTFAGLKKFVWGLTGSPMPHAVTDVWSQAKIITPNTVPKYFKGFRDATMLQMGPFTWVPKPDAVTKAFAALQPAVRYTLDDIMELPTISFIMQEVQLGALQTKVYKEIAAKCYAMVQAGEITAVNAGAALTKLLQISLGWVYTSDGATAKLDGGSRLDTLIDIIEACNRKVLVFAPYKHVLGGITKALGAAQIDYAAISGDTPIGERTEVFNAFQSSSRFRVIAAHPATMSHGLTLTAANTIVWYGPVTSLETFEQANARIRRPSQKEKQLIICMHGTPVERKMYALLKSKQNVQNQLLELFTT